MIAHLVLHLRLPPHSLAKYRQKRSVSVYIKIPVDELFKITCGHTIMLKHPRITIAVFNC